MMPLAFRRRGGEHRKEAAPRRIDRTLLMHCKKVVTMEPRIVKRGAAKLIGMMPAGPLAALLAPYMQPGMAGPSDPDRVARTLPAGLETCSRMRSYFCASPKCPPSGADHLKRLTKTHYVFDYICSL